MHYFLSIILRIILIDSRKSDKKFDIPRTSMIFIISLEVLIGKNRMPRKVIDVWNPGIQPIFVPNVHHPIYPVQMTLSYFVCTVYGF